MVDKYTLLKDAKLEQKGGCTESMREKPLFEETAVKATSNIKLSLILRSSNSKR